MTMAAAVAMILAGKPPRFPFILLTGFDQKASIKIGENPNLERKRGRAALPRWRCREMSLHLSLVFL
jgi:hypothetical protein